MHTSRTIWFIMSYVKPYYILLPTILSFHPKTSIFLWWQGGIGPWSPLFIWGFSFSGKIVDLKMVSWNGLVGFLPGSHHKKLKERKGEVSNREKLWRRKKSLCIWALVLNIEKGEWRERHWRNSKEEEEEDRFLSVSLETSSKEACRL